ncbi:agmatinase [Saccharomonospora azurea]|uniref:agmatinase n=1 Tax=Saccharomonospora azurea TaxID=40988 RepID=UPI003D8F5EE9
MKSEHTDDNASWPYPIKQDSRDPGPLNVHRNANQPAYVGIPTFMSLPICLTPEDLRAGDVDVAVLGAPVDTSTGHRGAAFGPRALRADERYLFNNTSDLVNASTRIKPFDELTVVDYGDAAVDLWSIENTERTIGQVVSEVLDVGAVPIVMGGDHSVMVPNVRALVEKYGADKLAVVHFDAHPDCHEEIYGHTKTHATTIWRLVNELGVPGHNIVQAGIRTPGSPDNQLFHWMRKAGIHTHFMAEIERLGLPAVVDKVIAEASDGAEVVYVSLDIDVVDPAYAPGTGTPEPGGLSGREILTAFRRLCHELPVVGMDVVEVAPHLDPGYHTALLARRVILESISGLAMRKAGISTRDYRHPVVSGEIPFAMPARRS